MKILEKEEFSSQMKEKTANIEKLLETYLPDRKPAAGENFQKTIFDAMEYSLMAGGKRLRPLFIQESYVLFGGKEEKVVQAFMAAMEMIHTYSLVHDDLPAMDNDDYRRGKLTTHKVFGEDMGILAGDALLNYAYETALQGVKLSQDKENAIRGMEILTRKAGVFGMVGGQVVDVEMTGKNLSQEQIEFIYRLKTGALLEASLMIGAALTGQDNDILQKMETIGKNIGMAFQIRDDILDLTSTTRELGKPVHSDEKNDKNTYVTLHGMERSEQAVEKYSREALELLESIPGENTFLNTLVMELIHRKK